MTNISHRLFRLHWLEDHPQEIVPFKKTGFLFHNKLHINLLVKAVLDLRRDFSVVDEPAFKLLLQAYNINKYHPCRKSISSIIVSKRHKLSLKVADKLENAALP